MAPDTAIWTVRSTGDLFSDWSDISHLRAVTGATTRRVPLKNGAYLINIVHENLSGVTPKMLEWWFTHFPYYAVALPDGDVVSAYRLWHPHDHQRVKIKRHSLSGQLGMTVGARLELRGSWGALPRKSVLRIRHMNQRGLLADILFGPWVIGVIDERFEPSYSGTQLVTTLRLRRDQFAWLRPFRLSWFSPVVLDAWVKHKIEEVGNLERVVPPLFHSAGKICRIQKAVISNAPEDGITARSQRADTP
jgi:hypothetical protein